MFMKQGSPRAVLKPGGPLQAPLQVNSDLFYHPLFSTS